MSVGDNLPATGRPLAGPARTTWPILMAISLSHMINDVLTPNKVLSCTQY